MLFSLLFFIVCMWLLVPYVGKEEGEGGMDLKTRGEHPRCYNEVGYDETGHAKG